MSIALYAPAPRLQLWLPLKLPVPVLVPVRVVPPAAPATPAELKPPRKARRRKRRPRARRRARQEPRRQAEARRRRQAVRASNACHRRVPLRELAASCEISERTLYRWRQADRTGEPAACPRGRRLKKAPVWVRNQLFEVLCLCGSGIGVPTLRKYFPEMGKRETEEFMRRFKQVERHQDGKLLHKLGWRKPGTAWTMDYTEPDQELEEPYTMILAVRDLASNHVLAWRAVEHDDAHTTANTLKALFASHGPPLVLKSDNGSHFKGEVPELLAQRGVAHLLSPILTPTYNGACEAAIGNLKARTHEFACRADHPEYWDLDDLEGAKLQTNEAKLRRKRAVAFDDPELYHCRKPWEKIPESERSAFAAALAEEELKLRKEVTDTNQEPLSSQDEVTIRRKAISRACVACDLLVIRKKRISTPNRAI